jgi:molybdopterin-guanine dinucleotide biosynthesis protein MobB
MTRMATITKFAVPADKPDL